MGHTFTLYKSLKQRVMEKATKKITVLALLVMLTISGFAQYNNAFRFRINGNGHSDETIVRLVNDASQEFDGSYDAWKFFSPNPNVPSIYTQIEEGEELSINSLPEFTEDVSIVLYTNIPVSGTYTLDVEEVFALSSNYKVSISDIESDVDFLFLGDTALTFTFNAQQKSPTFTFNISSAATITTIDESCSTMKNGGLNVDNKGNTDWTIAVVDTNNNIVVSESLTIPFYSFNNLSAGDYTAIVSSKGIVDTYSFTINPGGVAVAIDFDMSNDTLYIDEGAELFLTNNSQNSLNNLWSFGDGNMSTQINPIHNYSSVGTFDVTLSVTNDNCVTEKTKQVVVYLTQNIFGNDLATSIDENNASQLSLNNLGNGNFEVAASNFETKQVRIFDLKGSLVFEDVFSNNNYSFSLANNPSGIYIANIVSENGQVLQDKIMR
jgi:PKD repeat protein